MSSFEKVRPGMIPLFFNQNIAANEPEKNIPSTAANAIRRCLKLAVLLSIQVKAHFAFFSIHEMVEIAWSRWFFIR